jgi:hypothetical protein
LGAGRKPLINISRFADKIDEIIAVAGKQNSAATWRLQTVLVDFRQVGEDFWARFARWFADLTPPTMYHLVHCIKMFTVYP